MAEGEGPGGAKIIRGPWDWPPPASAVERLGASSGGSSDGGGSPPLTGLAERIARLEAAIEGLRHSQNLTIGATAAIGGILAAMIIGFGVYSLQRIDQTQEAISREAAATRKELVGVATAIANSITAARQVQPAIVVIPSPSTQPASPPPQSPRSN
jgi:hypothetical protein